MNLINLPEHARLTSIIQAPNNEDGTVNADQAAGEEPKEVEPDVEWTLTAPKSKKDKRKKNKGKKGGRNKTPPTPSASEATSANPTEPPTREPTPPPSEDADIPAESKPDLVEQQPSSDEVKETNPEAAGEIEEPGPDVETAPAVEEKQEEVKSEEAAPVEESPVVSCHYVCVCI